MFFNIETEAQENTASHVKGLCMFPCPVPRFGLVQTVNNMNVSLEGAMNSLSRQGQRVTVRGNEVPPTTANRIR